MRIFNKTFLLTVSGIIFVLGIISAQEVPASAEKPKLTQENITLEQIALLKANRSKQIEFRNSFRQTLSGEQLNILTTPGLSREEKLKSLRNSLNDNQVKMIKANKKQVRIQNFTQRATLSNQQRMQIRRMAMNRSQQNRVLFRRSFRHRR